MALLCVERADDVKIPSSPGTYALVLYCPHNCRLEVGKLGKFKFKPGWYAYVGSAFGRGGLRARCLHHLRPALRPRWHIDYLKAAAPLKAIWYTTDPVPREHQWANLIERRMHAGTPVPRFGSSDCACPSHLFHLPRKPSIEKFREAARRRLPGHTPISAFVLKPSRQAHQNAL